jgi:hypothetical protein
MNYTENVRTKSLGWAIVLTLIFGPLGLFYASVSGGLIMTLTPLALFVLLLLGAVTQSSILLASSGILLIIFALSYWIICVIWAATSVSNYNNKVINDSRHEEFLRLLDENNQANNKIVQNVVPTELTKVADNQNLDQPTIKVWKQQNPNRSLNEYYQIYGVPPSIVASPTYTYEEAYYIHEKPSKSWLYITLAIGFVVMIAVITNPNEDKHKSAVKSKLVASKISENIADKSSNTGNSDDDAVERLGTVLGLAFGSSVVEEIVNSLVSTDNYLVFSITKVVLNGKSKTIGFGIFGNVFISDKLDLDLLYSSESDIEKEKTLNKIEQKSPKEVEPMEVETINNNEQNLNSLEEPTGTEWRILKNESEFSYVCFENDENPDLKISVCFDKNIRGRQFDRIMKAQSIKYKGQEESIPLFFQKRNVSENGGIPAFYWADTYNETYQGKVTGTFTFTNAGTYGLDVNFRRKRDGKEFYFQLIESTQIEKAQNEEHGNDYNSKTTPCF